VIDLRAMFGLESASLSKSAKEKLAKHYKTIHVSTDQMFAALMMLQWVGGVAMALFITPLTWIGDQSQIHPHVLMAVFGGGLLAAMPVVMTIFQPGTLPTRMVIACSQVLFSSLLIHLSGGRLETHFHVFGSLAFLAAYRDPRLFPPATLIVAVDHLVRGLWWPQSVFGIATASEWRWLEHAAWVLFEDGILLIIIMQSRKIMLELAIHTDRLEQREAELEQAIQEADRANRTKSKFLANMSHEIRTPLNGILGFTEVLIRDRQNIPDEEMDEHLHTIRRSGKHLLTLINDVLDLSKIEAGQMSIQSVPCSPHQIISDTVSVLRVTAAEKGINLDYRWDSPVPDTIRTDPYRLKQLLLNIVGNAVKFTDQGSVLIVSRITENEYSANFHIEVRDTGIGIAPDKLDAIFKPFVQADDSVTRKYGGTGLGLAISKKIAEALGGSLAVTSSLGKGTVFVIDIAAGEISHPLPERRLQHHPGADIKGQATQNHDLHDMSLLVVDDGDTNRKLLRLLLERGGAKVRLAENGQVAVELALQASFDAILMDMQMPVMDGYTAAARLRERGYAGEIIALTAHAMSGDREKCEQAGCSGYLSKPVDADELYKLLGSLTRKSNEPAADYKQEIRREIEGKDTNVIHSVLPTSDEEIREIVLEFLDTLDSKVVEMQLAWDAGDMEALSQLAHWLKGSAGTVGFNCFTAPAGELESVAKVGDTFKASMPLKTICDLKRRVVL
jgi:signal transduction histidine kinase/CheY-like chemotaxis protein